MCIPIHGRILFLWEYKISFIIPNRARASATVKLSLLSKFGWHHRVGALSEDSKARQSQRVTNMAKFLLPPARLGPDTDMT